MKPSVLIFLACSLIVSVAQAQSKKKSKTETVAPQPQPEPKLEELPKPQEQPNQVVNPMTEHFYKKYVTALQWNDNEVAKNALYDLIIENPQNDSLIFNLAYYYYENQQYPSSVLVSQQLLTRNPKNLAALEISAVGFEAMGVPDRSLQNYESLYLLTNNINTLYKMAFLQYDLKRFAECLASIDILLASKDLDASKVSYNDGGNKPKDYPMKVAILNLKGMAVQEHLGDKVAAKKLYTEALGIAPDFTLAKENLAKLK